MRRSKRRHDIVCDSSSSEPDSKKKAADPGRLHSRGWDSKLLAIALYTCTACNSDSSIIVGARSRVPHITKATICAVIILTVQVICEGLREDMTLCVIPQALNLTQRRKLLILVDYILEDGTLSF